MRRVRARQALLPVRRYAAPVAGGSVALFSLLITTQMI
jgi:hypothetical protein